MKHLGLLFLLIILFSFAAHTEETKVIPFNLKQNSSDSALSKNDLLENTEKILFESTNSIRTGKRLNTLKFNPILYKAANLHSKDMLKRRYFSHYSPEGNFVLNRIRKFKPGYDESCGENLHQIYTEQGLRDPQSIAEIMMKDWMGSPEHRKNILSKEYTLMGIACDTDGFHIICTQVFSGPNL